MPRHGDWLFAAATLDVVAPKEGLMLGELVGSLRQLTEDIEAIEARLFDARGDEAQWRVLAELHRAKRERAQARRNLLRWVELGALPE